MKSVETPLTQADLDSARVFRIFLVDGFGEAEAQRLIGEQSSPTFRMEVSEVVMTTYAWLLNGLDRRAEEFNRFGEAVRRSREVRGLTHGQLASLCGARDYEVMAFENGEGVNGPRIHDMVDVFGELVVEKLEQVLKERPI